MSYQTSYDYSYPATRASYSRGYPKTCGAAAAGNHVPVDCYTSQVTSWRGPIETLRVGSKKRRVFHSFFRHKFHLVTPNYWWYWCPPTSAGVWSMKSRDFQPWMLRRSWEWWRAGTYPHKRVGCTYPVYTRTPCREFGEKYRDLIVSDLYSKLKEPRYDLAVVLAEIGETIYMVKDLLLGLVKTFTRTGHALKTARHFTLNSEELWLWYRYALLPTMLDIEDLLKAIKPQAKIDRCQTGKPKKSVQLHGRIYTYGWGPNLESTYFPWTQNLKVGVGGAADIIKRVDPSEWGTSAVDILRAGWEIIPFSFIFDWFVNMGDFLTTLRNVQLEFAQSYATYAVESELKMGIGPYQTCEGVPTLRQVTIERIIDIEPPYHPLVNSEFMNLNRSVDAIALASGMIKNILKSGGKVKRRRK